MAELITHEQFSSTSGQNYRLNASTPVDVILVEVTELKDCGGGFESFSLLFVGDENAVVPQNTYEMQNETIGDASIFISPVHYPQAEDGKTYYPAVFSHKKT